MHKNLKQKVAVMSVLFLMIAGYAYAMSEKPEAKKTIKMR